MFLRFAGCNLWSGFERDRASAVCQFCDTDFVGTDGPGGGKFATAHVLADAVYAAWPAVKAATDEDAKRVRRYVVCTGGEPLLQLDAMLVEALHDRGFEVAIETNGTKQAPPEVDWICVSPKANATLVQKTGHELKLVFPQQGAAPDQYERLAFDHFFLQPMDGPKQQDNIALAAAYCLQHPKWRLSLQMHKLIGLR